MFSWLRQKKRLRVLAAWLLTDRQLRAYREQSDEAARVRLGAVQATLAVAFRHPLADIQAVYLLDDLQAEASSGDLGRVDPLVVQLAVDDHQREIRVVGESLVALRQAGRVEQGLEQVRSLQFGLGGFGGGLGDGFSGFGISVHVNSSG